MADIRGIVGVRIVFDIAWKKGESPEQAIKIISEYTEAMGKALIEDKRLLSDIGIEAIGNGVKTDAS